MLPKSTNKHIWFRMYKERFWGYVEKTETCWIWNAGKFENGYGMFTVNGFPKKAHRISYEMENGPIQEGLCICHKCDVKSCVRPSHLFIGTIKDNVLDAINKSRHYSTRPGMRSKLRGTFLKESIRKIQVAKTS